jgi:hypothetical protein
MTLQNEEMIPLEDALRFGGVTLAHAAWIASDLHDGEVVCPIVMIEKDDSREVLACEASTQQEAVELGTRKTQELTYADVDRWAFAREGLIKNPESTDKFDVLLVSCWSKGLDEPIKVLQMFSPNWPGSFRLIGLPVVVIHEHASPEPAQTNLRMFVKQGIESHPHGSMWDTWHSEDSV